MKFFTSDPAPCRKAAADIHPDLITVSRLRESGFMVLMDVGGDGVVRSGSQKMELGSNGCLLVPASEEEIEFIPGSGGLKMLIGQL